MTERKEITLPIKCSTVKCAYEVLREIALVIGVLLPFIGAAMCVASWYIFAYVDQIKIVKMTSLGPVIYYSDTALFLGFVGFFSLMIGIIPCSMILSDRYKISCIKDD
jgi:hypothetical protein